MESQDAAVAAVVNSFYQLPKRVVEYVEAKRFPCVGPLRAVYEALETVKDLSPATALVRTYADELSTGNEPDGHLALKAHLAEQEVLLSQARKAGAGQGLLDPQPVFAEWARAIAEQIVTNIGTPPPEFSALPLEHRCLALAYPLLSLNDRIMAHALPEVTAGKYPDDVMRYSLGQTVQPILSTVVERLGWLPGTAGELKESIDRMNAMRIRPYLLDDAVRDGRTPAAFKNLVTDLAALRSICCHALGQLPREETLTRIHAGLCNFRGLLAAPAPFKEEYLPEARVAVILDTTSNTEKLPLVLFDGFARTAVVGCAAMSEKGDPAIDTLVVCRDGSLGNSPSGVLFPEATSDLYRATKGLVHQAYATAYGFLSKVWEACPEAISLFSGERFIHVAPTDKNKIAIWAPQTVVSSLRERVQVQEVRDEDLLSIARALSSDAGTYEVVTIAIANDKAEVEAELSPLAPQISRDERGLRAEIREILNRDGNLDFSGLVRALRPFGVWHDKAEGNGSHGALFCERQGRMRYTTCTSIRVAEVLPPRIVFDVVKGLGISLQEFRDSLLTGG
jgi:hypothetical protein